MAPNYCALRGLAPVLGVPYRNVAIDLQELFGRENKKYLEIDFGMGVRIAHIAAAFLERNFLAIEVHTAGVSALLKTIGETGLQNIRVVQHDAVDVSRRSYLLSRPVA